MRREKFTKLRGEHIAAVISGPTVTISTASPYNIDKLVELKGRVNETKSSMDKYYIGAKTDKSLAQRWGRLNSIMDIYRPLKSRIMKHYNGQLVTNAWIKYYELYNKYELVRPAEPFVAFFNAELPGAAVCAFNHYVKTSEKLDAIWYASSLAPDGTNESSSSVFGDYYGLFASNRSHWLMQLDEDLGNYTITDKIMAAADKITMAAAKDKVASKADVEDRAKIISVNEIKNTGADKVTGGAAKSSGIHRNNGDVTVIANLLDWEARIGPKSSAGGVHLYSSDAGIDVSGTVDGRLNFNNQESANAKIHLGCAIAGLITMRPGGSMVLKQYTFFETFTWNLILIYAGLFETFHVCKPVTSRPYNSEVYLIGKGFKGIPDSVREMLIHRLANFSMAPFIAPGDLDRHAVSGIINLAGEIFGQQIKFIEENMEAMKIYGANNSGLNELNEIVWPISASVVSDWITTYRIKHISRDDWLPFVPRKNNVWGRGQASSRQSRDANRWRGGHQDNWRGGHQDNWRGRK